MRAAARAIILRENEMLVMDRNKFGHHYLSLIGGHVDSNEKPEEAALREVREETTLEVANPRLVIVEEAGEVYGRQYIYLCDYQGGEPKLSQGSIEDQINAGGQNLYQPIWIKSADLAGSNLLPTQLKDLLVTFLKDGFPEKPVELLITNGSQL